VEGQVPVLTPAEFRKQQRDTKKLGSLSLISVPPSASSWLSRDNAVEPLPLMVCAADSERTQERERHMPRTGSAHPPVMNNCDLHQASLSNGTRGYLAQCGGIHALAE